MSKTLTKKQMAACLKAQQGEVDAVYMYEKRYLRHFRNPDILRFDMQHEAWIFQKEWTQPILDAMAKCMK